VDQLSDTSCVEAKEALDPGEYSDRIMQNPGGFVGPVVTVVPCLGVGVTMVFGVGVMIGFGVGVMTGWLAVSQLGTTKAPPPTVPRPTMSPA
jgi:hypothetical protein